MDSPSLPNRSSLRATFGKRWRISCATRRFRQVFSQGQVTAIVGPSGSGKSTFLRTLNRRSTRQRQNHHRRHRTQRQPSTPRCHSPRSGHGVSKLQPVFAHDHLRNVSLAPIRVRKNAEEGSRRKGNGFTRAGRAQEPGAQIPGAALRRSATT